MGPLSNPHIFTALAITSFGVALDDSEIIGASPFGQRGSEFNFFVRTSIGSAGAAAVAQPTISSTTTVTNALFKISLLSPNGASQGRRPDAPTSERRRGPRPTDCEPPGSGRWSRPGSPDWTEATAARVGASRTLSGQRRATRARGPLERKVRRPSDLHWDFMIMGYCMTSSARNSTDCGIVSPSALAVLRLTTSSNFAGCSTGRSAGFAPLRILST